MSTSDIFSLLIKEHLLIRKMIAEAKKSKSCPELLLQLKQIFEFAELHHHFQEEELLFKPASRNPRIKQGGPFCGYFFDVHIQNDPLEKACKLTHQTLPSKDLKLIPERLRYLFEENNPARIPIEEHLAGKLVLEDAIRISSSADSKENLSSSLKLLEQYDSIQDIHYAKEETCFFALCKELFTKEELAKISEQFLKTK